MMQLPNNHHSYMWIGQKPRGGQSDFFCFINLIPYTKVKQMSQNLQSMVTKCDF